MYIHHYKLSTHGCNIVAKKGMEWQKLNDCGQTQTTET